jgi:hypothetical protein
MTSRKLDEPLSVRVPSAADDRTSWTKVAVIAAVGFAVGVAWPRLSGIRLGPSAPESSASAKPAPSGATGEATAAVAPAPATAAASAPAATPPPASVTTVARGATTPATKVALTTSRGSVLGCRTSGGENLKGNACGAPPALDPVAVSKLGKLAACPSAAGARGKLSVVLTLDFASDRVRVDFGKSSTVPDVEGFARCVRPEWNGVSIAGLTHEHPRYTMMYAVTFAGDGERAPDPAKSPAAPRASGGG